MTELADVFSGVKPLTRVEKNGNCWRGNISVFERCSQFIRNQLSKSHYYVITVGWGVADEDQKFHFGCPSPVLPWEISYSLSTSCFLHMK